MRITAEDFDTSQVESVDLTAASAKYMLSVLRWQT